MDYYISLLGNLGPIHDDEGTNKTEETPDDEEVTEPEIRTIVMCGCGNHPINPKK